MAHLTGLFRLGRDSELRFTADGTPICNLALAFNYGKKGQDGNRPTQWVDAAIYGKRAESLHEYLVKGVAIVATLQDPHIRTFQKNDGTPGFTLSASVLDLEFAGGGQQQQRSEPRQQPQQQERQAAPPRQAPQRQPAGNLADMDDDIPF